MNSKLLVIGIICLLAPIVIAAVRDFILPFGPIVFFRYWYLFPIFSLMLFVTAFPLYAEDSNWGRKSSATINGVIAGVLGIYINGAIGLVVGLISGYVCTVFLTLSVSKRNVVLPPNE